MRWLWGEDATGAVLEFLEDTRVGCRVSSGRARVDEERDEDEVPGPEGEEGPRLFFVSFFCHFFTLSFVGRSWGAGDRVARYDL